MLSRVAAASRGLVRAMRPVGARGILGSGGSLAYDDAFLLDQQLSEEERMIRVRARAHGTVARPGRRTRCSWAR